MTEPSTRRHTKANSIALLLPLINFGFLFSRFNQFTITQLNAFLSQHNIDKTVADFHDHITADYTEAESDSNTVYALLCSAFPDNTLPEHIQTPQECLEYLTKNNTFFDNISVDITEQAERELVGIYERASRHYQQRYLMVIPPERIKRAIPETLHAPYSLLRREINGKRITGHMTHALSVLCTWYEQELNAKTQNTLYDEAVALSLKLAGDMRKTGFGNNKRTCHAYS